MLDTENDPLNTASDPPDNQGGGTSSTLAADTTDTTNKSSDPPDNQGGGTA